MTVRVGLAAALLTVGLIGTPAAIVASNEQTTPQGHAPGLADGWNAPESDDGMPGTETVGVSTSTPTRTGYAAGRPDGRYEPGADDAQVAGVALTGATLATVPTSVR